MRLEAERLIEICEGMILSSETIQHLMPGEISGRVGGVRSNVRVTNVKAAPRVAMHYLVYSLHAFHVYVDMSHLFAHGYSDWIWNRGIKTVTSAFFRHLT